MHAQFNRFELENFSRNAANAFLRDGEDLNDTITKMAGENQFTPHHVDRVVQNANTFVNAALVTKAREDGDDPRVTFPMAKSAEVSKRANKGSHKLAQMRKEAEFVDLFTVDGKGFDKAALLDSTIGRGFRDPYADQSQSVDHMKLASDFLTGDQDARNVNAVSLGLACQTLKDLEHRAISEHSLAKEAMDSAERSLCKEINDQILYGASPATIRDVVKNASLNANVVGTVDKMITKVASDLMTREGKSVFIGESLVNASHPLIEKSAAIRSTVDDAVRTWEGLGKLSSAHKNAQKEYAQAVREGR